MSKPLSLNDWRLQQELGYRELGEMIGVRGNKAYRYCLPPGHKSFQRPGDLYMARIYHVTAGEVPPNSFYKLPKLTRPFDPAAPELALEAA